LFLPEPQFIGLRIPTLDEVLTRYGSTIGYYIETKNPELYPGIEADLVALLRKHGVNGGSVPRASVYLESFSAQSLLAVHAIDQTIPLVQLFNRATASALIDELDQVRSYASAIGPEKSDVTSALVEASHARCLFVHPYVVDDEDEMLSLLAVGVDGIFTDRPDRLARMIGRTMAQTTRDNGCTT
jgi:glycerophosphoryl diester phosphodiesterase